VTLGNNGGNILYIKAKMVSVRLSVRPDADLGFRTSMDGQDQVLKSRSLDGGGHVCPSVRYYFFYLIYLSYFLPAGGPAGGGDRRGWGSEGRYFFFCFFGSSLLFLGVAGVATGYLHE